MIRETLERYRAFMEGLSPADLDRLSEMYAPDVHFRDPFSDTRGLASLRVVFAKMFADAPDSKFQVLDVAPSGQGGYLKWHYTGTARGRCFAFPGLTEVAVRDEKIASHVDYYDAASNIYARFAGLGWLVRTIKRRVGHAD